ncbi:MAG TPA: serine hydrolase [Longimicrobiales bacterium]|nr:serine hydrolase [Longimicrobiales bacterium]
MHHQIGAIGAERGAEGVGVAYYDYHHRIGWGYRGDRWFHAASTIKVPVLLGVFDAIERGHLRPQSRVHVRNRFLSVADGMPYRVEPSRDANAEVQGAVGRTMQIRELARHMIVTSSNLATNLLIEIVGLESIRKTIDRFGLHGIELRRGVEDMAAWETGINNRVTADGLLDTLRVIQEEEHFSEELRGEMLDILHGQEFRGGIPAGLPDTARVANKTGEISTVAHDAGIVFLPDREPYIVVILTEWQADASVAGRKDTIARISRIVYEHVTDGDGDGDGEGDGEGVA